MRQRRRTRGRTESPRRVSHLDFLIRRGLRRALALRRSCLASSRRFAFSMRRCFRPLASRVSGFSAYSRDICRYSSAVFNGTSFFLSLTRDNAKPFPPAFGRDPLCGNPCQVAVTLVGLQSPKQLSLNRSLLSQRFCYADRTRT